MARTSPAPNQPEPPIEKRLWKVATLSGMASYLDAALIVSIAVNLAIYRDAYDMGVWMAGAISAIVTICIAVGSLVGGRLADVFGRRRLYNLDILCYALGAIIITLAPDDITLLVGVLARRSRGRRRPADVPGRGLGRGPRPRPGQAHRVHAGHVDAGHHRRGLRRLRPVGHGHDSAHGSSPAIWRSPPWSPGICAPGWSWPPDRTRHRTRSRRSSRPSSRASRSGTSGPVPRWCPCSRPSPSTSPGAWAPTPWGSSRRICWSPSAVPRRAWPPASTWPVSRSAWC